MIPPSRRACLQRIVALIFFVGTSGLSAGPETFTPSREWKEVVEPGEQALFEGIAREINEIQRATAAARGTPIDRGFHPKTHVVLRAQLTIRDDVPVFARVGLLATPATYPVWVRFSNGSPRLQDDTARDVRGFALKVMGVTGERLQPGDASTQDFLGINHEAQPARNIHQFMALVRGAGSPMTLPLKLARQFGILESGRIMSWLARTLARRTRSLATTDYHTSLPHQFGPHAGKVTFQAITEEAPGLPGPGAGYLRDGLVHQLRHGDVRYRMMVQFFVDEENTPIEDAAIVWSEDVSPKIPVAELVISARDLESPEAQAEQAIGNKLAFSPWNGILEHRPLGGLMRARRVVYPASSALRESSPEPTP